MEELVLLFVALLILILLIASNVHLFISLVIILALVGFLQPLKRYCEKDNETAKRKKPAPRFASSLAISFLEGLTETGLCVAVGLAIVILCNAGFGMYRDTGPFEYPDRLLAVENRLINICEYLKADFKPHLAVLISILIALAIIDKIIPKLGVMRGWEALQKFVSRATIVLTTISAFTFFTVEEVSRQEPQWVSQMRTHVLFSLNLIGTERKRIMAEAIIEDRIENLPAASRAQLKQFFQIAAAREDGKDIAGLAAKIVAHSDSEISRVSELLSPPTPNATDDTIARASRWLNAGDASIRIADVSALHDEAVKEVNRESAGEWAQTRTFLKEVLGGTFDAIVPDKMSEVVKRFLEIIVDSVSESIAGAMLPDAGDLASVKKRMTTREAAQILIPAPGDDLVWNLEALSHGHTVNVIVVRLGNYLQVYPSEIPKTSRQIQDQDVARGAAEAKRWIEEYHARRGEIGDHPEEEVRR